MKNYEIYEAARQRIAGLVDSGNADMDVPTCPGWTVKDLVAHLSGSLQSYISGDLEGASSPEWGNGHVRDRRDMSLDDCLREWDDHMASAGDMFESRLAPVAVADVLSHEQDIRTALGRPGHRDEEGIIAAVEMGLSFSEGKFKAAELPALRVVTNDIDRTLGDGVPAATLQTSTFELFRALHGRRTPDQVRALDWDGDPSPWMEAFFLFGPTERIVEEER